MHFVHLGKKEKQKMKMSESKQEQQHGGLWARKLKSYKPQWDYKLLNRVEASSFLDKTNREQYRKLCEMYSNIFALWGDFLPHQIKWKPVGFCPCYISHWFYKLRLMNHHF